MTRSRVKTGCLVGKIRVSSYQESNEELFNEDSFEDPSCAS